MANPLPYTPGSRVSYAEFSRIHPHHQGIATSDGVAFSIACDPGAGGPYSDRWLREGAVLDYCGQGRGADQTWNRYNVALRIAMEEGRPVHVFEDLEQRPATYLYHGAWRVLSYHEAEDPATGHRQFRFILSSEGPRLTPLSSGPMPDASGSADDLGEPPARVLATASRIIRDTKLSRGLKAEYSHCCQACGTVQLVGPETGYSEAHHLRPLGRPHDGPDARSNLLVLCAAHHVAFDYGAIAIDPSDGRTLIAPFDHSLSGRPLELRPRHRLDADAVRYHYETIFEARRRREASPGPGRLSSTDTGDDSPEDR